MGVLLCQAYFSYVRYVEAGYQKLQRDRSEWVVSAHLAYTYAFDFIPPQQAI